jgi:hypothetical protein
MSSSTTVSQIKVQTTPQKVFSVQKLAIRLGAFVTLLGIMIYFALSARGGSRLLITYKTLLSSLPFSAFLPLP